MLLTSTHLLSVLSIVQDKETPPISLYQWKVRIVFLLDYFPLIDTILFLLLASIVAPMISKACLIDDRVEIAWVVKYSTHTHCKMQLQHNNANINGYLSDQERCYVLRGLNYVCMITRYLLIHQIQLIQ